MSPSAGKKRPPPPSNDPDSRAAKRRRRSPTSSSSHHHHHRRRPTSSSAVAPTLPFNQAPLHKRDYRTYEPLFAEYLSLQKQIALARLDDRERRGRWKSFVRKWNEGLLARGWYEGETLRKARERWGEGSGGGEEEEEEEEEEEGDYGPEPGDAVGRFRGPALPALGDLVDRDERIREEGREDRLARKEEIKEERRERKERLEELVPRAEAGSRERMLEKKREKAAEHKAFRERGEGGDVEVDDGELMGGGEDEFRKKVKEQQRAKSEREIRREEVLRARAVEREEKMAKFRAKENKTMAMLKELAKQRFGGVSD